MKQLVLMTLFLTFSAHSGEQMNCPRTERIVSAWYDADSQRRYEQAKIILEQECASWGGSIQDESTRDLGYKMIGMKIYNLLGSICHLP